MTRLIIPRPEEKIITFSPQRTQRPQRDKKIGDKPDREIDRMKAQIKEYPGYPLIRYIS
jgi:hypothetical protein